jgi:hypothetical protein
MSDPVFASLLTEFVDLHCAFDGKSYTPCVDLIGAFFIFARNRGHLFKGGNTSSLDTGFIALLRNANLPGVELSGVRGKYDERPAIGVVCAGLRLAVYPTTDVDAIRAFGFE